jgi:CDP-glucose 4,6-dehydratase
MGVTGFWRGKRVLVTGHTGFKGAWLSTWVNALGAETFGFSLAPDTSPALFDQLQLGAKVDHVVADVRDRDALSRRIETVQPDIVFHLAAQALVRRSYRQPVMTWDVNVMGVVNLLESLRALTRRCACVVVTTDKVYQNREWPFAYRETDRLGGHDAYSASKAAAELAVASFRSAFFGPGSPVKIATARAGNVIGGGDWSEDRLFPDLVRAIVAGERLALRNPDAVRPWQHVLEPLSGYLRLAECLYGDAGDAFQSAFNFGPRPGSARTVRDVIELALARWDGGWVDASDPDAPHEARLLDLTIDKARAQLGWEPRWSLEQSIEHAIDWYREVLAGDSAERLTRVQIETYGEP